ncbi:hypothetical protein BDEG_24707 [Batrachochytrium dendrobatidis JEL423]|uniref:Uncharacterized protein n=1 Tax=Batrachochytrium dendrobatidis (strain JEL423) TaxID=403673 RepID=A0A177WLT4_BATDL|nr:hypothetical protein BDEG_24707 [Batrachochytrium dendrobatidis JEL423]
MASSQLKLSSGDASTLNQPATAQTFSEPGTRNSTTFGAMTTGTNQVSTPGSNATQLLMNENGGNSQFMLFDNKRPNYLDVLKEKLEKANKTSMIYTVIITGELAKKLDRVEFSSYYQKFFKRQQSENELITGVLLIYRESFAHVLEASQKVVYAFLRDIGSQPTFVPRTDFIGLNTDSKPQAEDVNIAMMVNTKVLLLSDNTSERSYPFWASKVIDSKEDSLEVDPSLFADDAFLDKIISDTCIGLLSVGTQLSSLNKSELKHAFEEISERFKDYLPHQNILNAITGCSNIISVDGWLKAFDSPMQLTFESGKYGQSNLHQIRFDPTYWIVNSSWLI